MVADVYNMTVNFNGETMFSRSYSPCFCRCGSGMYTMNSCFGFGYGGFGGGLGMGLGFAAGLALVPAMPAIFKGIGKACTWIGNTAAPFLWNNFFKPVGLGIWSGMKFVGNTVAKGAKAVAKGTSNLWNKIFHKKSKVKAEKAE